MARETGVRALRSIFEELLLEMRYSLPTNKETNRYVITAEIVEERVGGGKHDVAKNKKSKRDSA